MRGGKHSAMCLLRSAWLQEKREEVRIGAPFVLPSRNKLPREAVFSGRIAEDSTFIIVLSHCWARPEHPDPENRLLANVSEFLAYLDVSRHFGDGRPRLEEFDVGDREVLVFWDWPCLYQEKDGGVTPEQLDSFQRGLRSVNVLYGHVGTLCLLCTEEHFPPGSRPDHKGSGWPYFESLVSTLVKDQNKAVDLPRALEWVRTTGSEPDGNRSIYWLYEYVRRAERQLPVSPDVFDREVEHKRVTNGNDKQVLKDKFRETFLAVMQPAKKISLPDVPGPSCAEWRLCLQDTLRWCPRLQIIDLSCNESIAGATLEPFAALGATLVFLNVSMCVGFGGTLDALKHLRKLRQLYLYGCVDLEGSLEPLRDLKELERLDVEACFGLQGGVQVVATLPKLRILNISDTRLEVEGVAAGACRIGRRGDEVTPLFRAAHCGQAHTARRLLEGTANRRGVEVDRATTGMGTTPGRRPWVPRGRQGPPRAPRGCGQGEDRRFHAFDLRRAEGLRGGGPGVAGVSFRSQQDEPEEQVDSASPGRPLRPRRRCSPPSEESSGHHHEGPVERYCPGQRSTGRARRGGDASGVTLSIEIFSSTCRVCAVARKGIFGLAGHPIFLTLSRRGRRQSGRAHKRPEKRVSHPCLSLTRTSHQDASCCCQHCSCSLVPHSRWLSHPRCQPPGTECQGPQSRACVLPAPGRSSRDLDTMNTGRVRGPSLLCRTVLEGGASQWGHGAQADAHQESCGMLIHSDSKTVADGSWNALWRVSQLVACIDLLRKWTGSSRA